MGYSYKHLQTAHHGNTSTQALKGICQDFENFVNVLWIRSLIHVASMCERNSEIGFKVFEYSSFDFSAQIFL